MGVNHSKPDEIEITSRMIDVGHDVLISLFVEAYLSEAERRELVRRTYLEMWRTGRKRHIRTISVSHETLEQKGINGRWRRGGR